jgi:hypothetical protein
VEKIYFFLNFKPLDLSQDLRSYTIYSDHGALRYAKIPYKSRLCVSPNLWGKSKIQNPKSKIEMTLSGAVQRVLDKVV